MRSSCPGIAEWEDFAQRPNAVPTAEQLRAHLNDCADCRELLEHIGQNNRWAGSLRALWPGPSLTNESPKIPIGKRIGQYEISGLLGSGGMATVYRATQDHPRRIVALKVMKQGLASRSALRRFEHEAELLGRLQHPGIAQIFEAGVYDAGVEPQPFFAMELVNGRRLTDYARSYDLGIRERLELMVKIGEAVHHAHQKGIIHRDLKPANILVVDEEATEPRNHEATKGDQASKPRSEPGAQATGQEPRAGAWGSENQSAIGNRQSTIRSAPSVASCLRGSVASSAQPKVLDFGVARATDSDLQTTTLQTGIGQLIGTIPYMSPEQVCGDPKELDIRSDVYALGVVCYELLAGCLPYEIRNKTIPEAVRIIREEDPTPLSSVNKVFRGDIETIVGKALEKDKTRRYSSASAFVGDLRRYLDDEPISARPPSARYQLAKFAKRNKALVGGAVAVLLTLILGLAGTSYGFLRATAQRNRARESERVAETRRAEAETVIGLLKDMLSSANPHQVKGEDYTVRQLLDESAKGLGGRFEGQPQVEATIRATIGNAYRGLGLRAPSELHLKQALELRRRHLGPQHEEIAKSLCDYAWMLHDKPDYGAAERAFQEALEMQRNLLGPVNVQVAASLHGLSDIFRHQGRYEEAEPLARQALAMRRELLDSQHPDVAESLSNLGYLLLDLGRLDEAEARLREVLAIWRSLYGAVHPRVTWDLSALARVLNRKGDVTRAENAFQESLAVGREVFGDRHHDVAMIMARYGGLLRDNERYAEGETLLRNALAIQREVHEDPNSCLSWGIQELGLLYRRWGDFEKAEPFFREALAMRRKLSNPSETAESLYNLGWNLYERNEYDEAESCLRESLEIWRNLPGPRHRWFSDSLQGLGLVLTARRDFPGAEAALQEALGLSRSVFGEKHHKVADIASALGGMLTEVGRYSEAEALLTESYRVLDATKGSCFSETQFALRRLISLYEAWGKSETADKYRPLVAVPLPFNSVGDAHAPSAP